MQGRHRDSLDALVMYEDPRALAPIDAETSVLLRVQMGIAYNYLGDHPKAIALLNSTLRDATAANSNSQLGALYLALARVYRRISEHPIARGHSERSLEHFRLTGDWRGMAESYFAIALAEIYEGGYEAALENYEQALKLVGDRPAAYMLGRIYSNMAGAHWYLRRPHEGIRLLEKSIDYYERTDHRIESANGYNNLGINLMLVGDWRRAEEMYERALAVTAEADEQAGPLPMILDSLAELHTLRGDLTKAQHYVNLAYEAAIQQGRKWYICQTLRTRGRCHLAAGNPGGALEDGRAALEMAEKIGDRQAVCDSRLLLAEAQLDRGEIAECESELRKVSEQTSNSTADLPHAAEAQRVQGRLAQARNDHTLAAHHFGRAVSIFSILSDKYRTSLALFGLGRSYECSQPERAAEHLSRALQAFRELGAVPYIGRAEEALAALQIGAPEQRQAEHTAFAQLLTLRLAEATASRELLLRELAAVLHQETGASRVLVTELDEEGTIRVAASHGGTAEDNQRVAEQLCMAKNEQERDDYARARGAATVMLRPTNAAPAVVYVE
ncbi:MAG TPA: tetratricopeptide repeat protein, partial [Pyrinomonadaceae bacterium]